MGEDVDERDRARRWELVLPHRDRLLRLARGLVSDPGDAEACVQEALTRCVTFPALDEDNVVAFLVTTTRRLCMDHHRGRARDVRLAARLHGHHGLEPPPEESVCDRAEAAWVSERLADLPQRQRAVASARAAGYSPQEIADRLAVSYKTVETLLYRVRVRARAELERAYGVLALLAVRRPRATAAAAMAATSVAVVTGSLLLAPPARPGHASAPPAQTAPAATAAAPSTPRDDATRAGPAPAVPLPRPAPTPPPVPPSPSPSPSPSRPRPTCPAPPYLADPCVSPDPTRTPGLRVLDCLIYGIDREAGLQCRKSPAPSGSRPPGEDEG
jgi:RNA polymerase sigma-70 factor (ECF subfamily)